METQQITLRSAATSSSRVKVVPTLAGLAAVFWILTAIVGANDALLSDDEWQRAYLLYSVALMLSAFFTLATVLVGAGPERRQGLWIAGCVVGALGLLATVVAWALPLWMVTIGLGYLVLAAVDRNRARPLLVLGVSQFAGLLVTIAAIQLEVGPADSYGDYPYASAWGIATTAVGTCAALGWLVALGPRSQETRQA